MKMESADERKDNKDAIYSICIEIFLEVNQYYVTFAVSSGDKGRVCVHEPSVIEELVSRVRHSVTHAHR